MPDRFLKEPAFRHDTLQQVGILLINLGTPEAPTAAALKPYLRQFLSDPRVVEIPQWLWQPILRGIILNTRPKKSAQKYAQIWSKDGSPLKVYTEKLARQLQGFWGNSRRQPIVVDYAMRYGQPSVESALQRLKQQGCQRILAVPLYPQYAASSTASALDEVYRVLQQMRNMPELRVVKHFHDQADYIQALAKRVQSHWQRNGRPDKLLMSFHGVPKFSLDRGDPYHCECYKTARLLAEALSLGKDQYEVAFQSRFGKAEWLKPYVAETLQRLGQAGTGKLDVICPGFVADCLETLEEIAIEGKQTFLAAGGKEYRYIPCLNDEAYWVDALIAIVEPHLAGWIDPAFEPQQAKLAAGLSCERARALGAAQ